MDYQSGPRRARAGTTTTKKTLVIETISKSPTLAYLLAVQHFDTTSGRPTTTMPSSTLPGAAMVTLAVLGACVASVWSLLTPRHTAEAAATATVGTNISKKKKNRSYKYNDCEKKKKTGYQRNSYRSFL